MGRGLEIEWLQSTRPLATAPEVVWSVLQLLSWSHPGARQALAAGPQGKGLGAQQGLGVGPDRVTALGEHAPRSGPLGLLQRRAGALRVAHGSNYYNNPPRSSCPARG